MTTDEILKAAVEEGARANAAGVISVSAPVYREYLRALGGSHLFRHDLERQMAAHLFNYSRERAVK